MESRGIESMIDIPPDEFRRLGYRAVDLLADYFASLPQRAAGASAWIA
jgi:hypothetical protein